MEVGYSINNLCNDYIRESIREPLSDFLMDEASIDSSIWLLVSISVRRPVLSFSIIIYDLMDGLYENR